MKIASASEARAEVEKAQSLGEGPDADRHVIRHRERATDDLRGSGQRGNRRHHAGELRRRQDVRMAVPKSAAIWVFVNAEINMP